MYDSKMIDCKKILVFAKELILRCGSKEQAARYSEIAVSTFYRITSYEQCSLQVPTAKKLLLALDRKRREDRQNGHTPEALRKAKISSAYSEDRMTIFSPPASHFFEE